MLTSSSKLLILAFLKMSIVRTKDYFWQVLKKDPNEVEGVIKLPIKWMALERLQDDIFTEKTDVWSFGVTCWEVFSLGRGPYPGVDPFILIKYLEGGRRLSKPSNAACTENVYDIMLKCWSEQPEKHPTFADLVPTWTSILKEVAKYLDFSKLSSCETKTNYDHLEKSTGYDHLEEKTPVTASEGYYHLQ